MGTPDLLMLLVAVPVAVCLHWAASIVRVRARIARACLACAEAERGLAARAGGDGPNGVASELLALLRAAHRSGIDPDFRFEPPVGDRDRPMGAGADPATERARVALAEWVAAHHELLHYLRPVARVLPRAAGLRSKLSRFAQAVVAI